MTDELVMQVALTILSFPSEDRVVIRPNAEATLEKTFRRFSKEPQRRASLLQGLVAFAHFLATEHGHAAVAKRLLELIEAALATLQKNEMAPKASLLSLRASS